MSVKKNILILLVIVLNFNLLYAQDKVYTTRKTVEKIKVDATFNEKDWETADWQSNFTQFDPDNGKSPSQKTEFAILYNDNYLFVATKAYDNEPSKIENRMSARDSWDGDAVAIQIDSYNDKQTTFVLGVTASGVRNDGISTNDNFDEFNENWNPIWEVKTRMTDYGWAAEMKIPLSQLRFSNKKNQSWGLQFVRYIYRENEFNLWQHIERKASGWASRFGKLSGLKNLKPKRQVEIQPFFVAGAKLYDKEEGNPFADGADGIIDGGVNGKIGITNDLILDFAINPDFGQVEADPSEVNLTAFETYFTEKRPFFVEGNSITDFEISTGGGSIAGDNLFYSRRIGGIPHGYYEATENEYVKVPNVIRILGAMKLTGKTKNGVSIGIIESVTNKENSLISKDGNIRKEVIEPYTNYLLGRVQKDINKGNTSIGGMFTSTYRFSDSKNVNFLNTSAFTGGIDFKQYFKNKKYYILAKVSGSHISGSQEAIYNQQTASSRYFQRPDIPYVKLDSSLTSLTGTGGSLMFAKQANSGLRYSLVATWRSPEFELNDVGYNRITDRFMSYFWMKYSTKPFSIFRQVSISATEWIGFDFGGNNNFTGANVDFGAEFKNHWSIYAGTNGEFQGIDNTALRGGPALYTPAYINYYIRLNTPQNRKLKAAIVLSGSQKSNNAGQSINIFSTISYSPINILSLNLVSNYSDFNNELQYIEQIDNMNYERYIFGNIMQKTLSFTLRFDFNISPDFSIQYYSAPFLSGAKYNRMKYITDSKAENYDDRFHIYNNNELQYIENENLYSILENNDANNMYNFGNPDFNFKAYNSNLVLKWEYTPGSLLYLVWSQARQASETGNEFNYFNDLKNVFSISSQDVFLIKLSYMFGV